ncbi:hypothetical protein PLESTB_000788500 [Pleodorina starrii]|uniref:Uncharacterized protein n=1 Tax=Pleodorina starrii TaxID=330485 RepID=A0A9W6BKI7_9CHLO|nr:hypothetical protein PLESTM_000496300 [Pleodorina starrii]GLC53799.1 hypothetical protein PLESTB_000788500 [Pleodorina starrii]GLC72978.1 hypothetical protein PLESTF_001316000 [Pleodorina starrii]
MAHSRVQLPQSALCDHEKRLPVSFMADACSSPAVSAALRSVPATSTSTTPRVGGGAGSAATPGVARSQRPTASGTSGLPSAYSCSSLPPPGAPAAPSQRLPPPPFGSPAFALRRRTGPSRPHTHYLRSTGHRTASAADDVAMRPWWPFPPPTASAGSRSAGRVLQVEEAPLELPSTPRMPVRFVVSHVVVSSGLLNLILEGRDGNDASVRMPLPLPPQLWPQFQGTWGVPDRSRVGGDATGACGGGEGGEEGAAGRQEPQKPTRQSQPTDAEAKGRREAAAEVRQPWLLPSRPQPQPQSVLMTDPQAQPPQPGQQRQQQELVRSVGAQPPPPPPPQQRRAQSQTRRQAQRKQTDEVSSPRLGLGQAPSGPAAGGEAISDPAAGGEVISGRAAPGSLRQPRQRSDNETVPFRAAAAEATAAAAAHAAVAGAGAGTPTPRRSGTRERPASQPGLGAARGGSGGGGGGAATLGIGAWGPGAPGAAPKPAAAAAAVAAAAAAVTSGPPIGDAGEVKPAVRTTPASLDLRTWTGAGGSSSSGSSSGGAVPLLPRPAPPSVARLLAGFRPTRLVRRTGTLYLGLDEQPRQWQWPDESLEPGETLGDASPSALGRQRERQPQPQQRQRRRLRAEGQGVQARLPPLLRLLRSTTPPSSTPSEASAAGTRQGGTTRAERASLQRQNSDGAPPSAAVTHGSAEPAAAAGGGVGTQRRRGGAAASFRPTVLVSRRGSVSVRSEAEAAWRKWDAAVEAAAAAPDGAGALAEGAGALAEGGSGSASGQRPKGGALPPVLLQILRAVNPPGAASGAGAEAGAGAAASAVVGVATPSKAGPQVFGPGRAAAAPAEEAAPAPAPAPVEQEGPSAALPATAAAPPAPKASADAAAAARGFGAVTAAAPTAPKASAAGQTTGRTAAASRIGAVAAAAAGAAASAREGAAAAAAAARHVASRADSGPLSALETSILTAATLEQLYDILDERMDELGPRAVALSCRVLIGLVQRGLAAAAPVTAPPGASAGGGGGSAAAPWCSAVTGAVHCYASALDYKDQYQQYGRQHLPGGGGGGGGGGGLFRGAAARQAVGRGRSRDGGVPSPPLPPSYPAALSRQRHDMQRVDPEEAEAERDQVISGARRRVGRLARRAAALVGTGAAAATAAAAAAAASGGSLAAEAALAAVWAYGHLAEPEDQMDLDLVSDLGLGLGPVPERAAGSRSQEKGQAQQPQPQQGSAAADSVPSGGGGSGHVPFRGIMVLLWRAVVGTWLQPPPPPTTTATTPPRHGDALHGPALGPPPSAHLHTHTARGAVTRPANAHGLSGLPTPPPPPSSPPPQWAMRALWAADRGAPSLLPAVLLALSWPPPESQPQQQPQQQQPGNAEAPTRGSRGRPEQAASRDRAFFAAAVPSAGRQQAAAAQPLPLPLPQPQPQRPQQPLPAQGLDWPGLRQLQPGQLVSVLWACGRYADWLVEDSSRTRKKRDREAGLGLQARRRRAFATALLGGGGGQPGPAGDAGGDAARAAAAQLVAAAAAAALRQLHRVMGPAAAAGGGGGAECFRGTLSRQDLLAALEGATTVLGAAEAEREVLALCAALSGHPSVRLQDLTTALNLLADWLPPRTPPEGGSSATQPPPPQQQQQQQPPQPQRQPPLAALDDGAVHVPAGLHSSPGSQLPTAAKASPEPPGQPLGGGCAATAAAELRQAAPAAEDVVHASCPSVSEAEPSAEGRELASAPEPASAPSPSPSPLLPLEMAVLRLLGGMSQEQAEAALAVQSLGSRGLRPVRGWYRSELRLPRFMPPPPQQQQEQSLPPRSPRLPSSPPALTMHPLLQMQEGKEEVYYHPPPHELQEPQELQEQLRQRLTLRLLERVKHGECPGREALSDLERPELGFGAEVSRAGAAGMRASAGGSGGGAGAVVRLVRRQAYPLPLRLRLRHGLGPAEGAGIEPAPPPPSRAAAAGCTTSRTAAPSYAGGGGGGSGSSSGGLRNSLELQLLHQQHLYEDEAVRRYGTADLLDLLTALGSAAAATGAGPLPRAATVRCLLNALALRWLRSGVVQRDVRTLTAALLRLRWRPRAVVCVFTTAWRPFVVLAPYSVSDAAVAGMAQVLGCLTSHDFPYHPGGRAAAAAEGSLPWPKLRRFWVNLLALATARLRTGGMRLHDGAVTRLPDDILPAPPAAAAGATQPASIATGAGAVGTKTTAISVQQPTAAAPPPLSVRSLIRLVWSSGRQGARVPQLLGLACRLLLPLLPQLPPREVGSLAWGLGQPRFCVPRVSAALLVLLRRWLAAADDERDGDDDGGVGIGGGGGGGDGGRWTAACRVATALLQLRALQPSAPELASLLTHISTRLHRRRQRQLSQLTHLQRSQRQGQRQGLLSQGPQPRLRHDPDQRQRQPPTASSSSPPPRPPQQQQQQFQLVPQYHRRQQQHGDSQTDVFSQGATAWCSGAGGRSGQPGPSAPEGRGASGRGVGLGWRQYRGAAGEGRGAGAHARGFAPLGEGEGRALALPRWSGEGQDAKQEEAEAEVVNPRALAALLWALHSEVGPIRGSTTTSSSSSSSRSARRRLRLLASRGAASAAAAAAGGSGGGRVTAAASRAGGWAAPPHSLGRRPVPVPVSVSVPGLTRLPSGVGAGGRVGMWGGAAGASASSSASSTAYAAAAAAAGSSGGSGGPSVLDLHPDLFRASAAYLASRAADLPPTALLQLLQVMAFSREPGALACPALLAAFGRLVEVRPRWLLRSEAGARLVLECYRRLGWWPVGQVEEVGARLQELGGAPWRRKRQLGR